MLTVRVDASIAWCKDLFDFEELVRDEHSGDSAGYAVVPGPQDWSMGVVLDHHPTNSGEAFDPTRTGLDHVGFVMPDRAALEEWETRLSDKGIKHSPITDHEWGFVPQLPGSRRHAAAAHRVRRHVRGAVMSTTVPALSATTTGSCLENRDEMRRVAPSPSNRADKDSKARKLMAARGLAVVTSP